MDRKICSERPRFLPRPPGLLVPPARELSVSPFLLYSGAGDHAEFVAPGSRMPVFDRAQIDTTTDDLQDYRAFLR